MKMFSRIAVLCNLAFSITVIMQMLGKNNFASEKLIPWHHIQNTIIVLGYMAILVNALYFLVVLGFGLLKRKTPVHIGYLIFNGILFVAQIFYFFILS